jgi:hypothetical protein
MTDQSVRSEHQPLPENPADRRKAPRLKAEDVPWIVTVRLGNGDAARLVDISRTGLLLETKERLRPGQKGTMTLGLAGGRSAHVQSLVVRSNLVAISHDAIPIYQAAILFARELESQLLAPGESRVATEDAAEKGNGGLLSPLLDGPFDALWATDCGSELVRVTSLRETGCIAHVPMPIDAGELTAVTIIFTSVRRLLLTGRVMERRSDGGYVVHFEGLGAEQRRVLRVELTSQAARWTPTTPPSGHASLFSIADAPTEPWVYTAGLQASDW